MEEEWWSSVLKGDCMWVTHTSCTRVCINTQEWQGQDEVEVKSMIDIVLVKKDMPHYVQEEVVDGTRRIRNEKLREHQYRDGYSKSLERERIEWDGESNVEYTWKKVKQPMADSEIVLWLSESREGG